MKEPIHVFRTHLPEPAVSYCYDLWQAHTFLFKITRSRQSKLGDYCYRLDQGHQITVNHDLNPYAFLITYLHEVAHLLVFKQYVRRKAPHGKEWKAQFRQLLIPMMTETVFPKPILIALQLYVRNPTAATNSFGPLKEALKAFDPVDPNLISLLQVAEGEAFVLGKRVFVKGELRRTRVVCTELRSGRKYTVLAKAMVKKV
ncbi:MAG: SprT-like domain-containing protein [Spirosomataceae bacterium]